MGQPSASTTGTGASIVAPCGRRERRRGTTASESNGQLLDTRPAYPGQTSAKSEDWELPEWSRRTLWRRPLTTTKRRIRYNSTGKAEAAIVGVRKVDKSGAKHIFYWISPTSKGFV